MTLQFLSRRLACKIRVLLISSAIIQKMAARTYQPHAMRYASQIRTTMIISIPPPPQNPLYGLLLTVFIILRINHEVQLRQI